MGKIVGISFKRCGKVYRFDTGELEIYRGDWVVVETARGMELGQVLYDRLPAPADGGAPIKTILRKAEPDDFKAREENRYKAAEAFRIGLEKIREHKLPMKLVDVEYTLDESKIVFYFCAEGRVDFRALVRDLAAVFKKRIELHQIGVRDVAKILGGLGPCGRTTCCSSFLTGFDPVSVKMAKEQSLSLNPVKISGSCGRLMCCLKYEYCQYQQLSSSLPEIGAIVLLDEGQGEVVDLNVPKQTVVIQMPSNARIECEASRIIRVLKAPKKTRENDSRTDSQTDENSDCISDGEEMAGLKK